MSEAWYDGLAERWAFLRRVTLPPNRLADVPTGEDKLGYTEFAEAIATKIVDAVSDGGTPFTIGIHGAWGSGKTSFLKLTEKELKKQKVRPIWFNAWKYNEEDNLWSALLQRILDDAPLNYSWYERPLIKLILKLENIDWHASGLEITGKFLLLITRVFLFLVGARIGLGLLADQGGQFLINLAPQVFANNPTALALIQNKATAWVSLALALIVADPKKVLDLFSGNLGLDISKFNKKRSYKNHIAYLDEFNDEFRRMIKLVSANKPLVVFIDDLDRCLPEKALQILEAIKLFLDVENCVFVVAVDRDIVEQAVSARYVKEMGLSEKATQKSNEKSDLALLAQNYIEKIIQLPFTLPPLPAAKIQEFVNFLYAHDEKDKCVAVFAAGLPPNPRKIKRVIQSFLLLRQIALKRMKDQEINFVLLAKLVIIENQYRLLHQEVVTHPALLDGIERSFRKEEQNLPTSVFPTGDYIEYQERVNMYSTLPGLRKLLLQSVQDATFVGINFSEYIFLIKTISEELPQPVDTNTIGRGKDAIVVGSDGIQVEGNIGGQIIVGGDTTNIITNMYPNTGETLPKTDVIRSYLNNLVASFQFLKLQGIRAGSQSLSVLLEKVYVPFLIADTQVVQPNTVSETLKRYRRLIILGDPGSGKTTLLAYLALSYAQDYREGTKLVKERFDLDEEGHLPIIIQLRDFGQHLNENYAESSKDGPSRLLDYLKQYYSAQALNLPDDFFIDWLSGGKAVLFFDGLDEVIDKPSRQRVARLIEMFTARYPACRFVVASREVGYDGIARIGEEFGLSRIQGFDLANVRQFIYEWTIAVETALAGSNTSEIVQLAESKAEKLISAIENNSGVAGLAVNPLLLTVIVLVYRYRAQLPERRSELYEEAIEILLGHWDAAKGMETEVTLARHVLDPSYKRSFLEPVAFWLHECKKRELERDDLRAILLPKFINLIDGDKEQAVRALDDFLRLITERSGLLVENGIGIYGFLSLVFQEYLAARVLAEREDNVVYSLKVLTDPWWREVIVLQAGYLSTQGTKRVTRLIRAILDVDTNKQKEPSPDYYLLLVADCVKDVGIARLEPSLAEDIQNRLQKLSSGGS